MNADKMIEFISIAVNEYRKGSRVSDDMVRIIMNPYDLDKIADHYFKSLGKDKPDKLVNPRILGYKVRTLESVPKNEFYITIYTDYGVN